MSYVDTAARLGGRRAPERRRFSIFHLLGLGAALLGVALLSGHLGSLLPGLHSPFKERTHDASPPAVVKALQDLSEYRAASGNYQQIIDVSKSTDHVPAILKGQHTTYLAVGSVDATVDFANLPSGAIVVSPDGKAVTVTLPAARLAKPTLDLQQSRVVARDRGLLDRVGDAAADNPASEKQLQLLAQDKLAAAASADGTLVARAEANTRAMLEGMLRSLGYTTVTVTFTAPPRG